MTIVIDDVAVKVDDTLAAQVRAFEEANKSLDSLVTEMLKEGVSRRKREAQGQAEMQAMLDGPHHPHAESHARMMKKFGFPDLSHLTADELADQAEEIIATMNPEVRAELEREGWL